MEAGARGRRLADPRIAWRHAAGLLLRPRQPRLLPGRRDDHVDACRSCPSGSRCSARALARSTQPTPTATGSSRQAKELGLQPLRWPSGWPPDTERAMLAATYAKRIGRGVAFSLAAFRQAFAGGRDLGDEDTVLIAGAACEMHPTALLKGIELQVTRRRRCRPRTSARETGRRHGAAGDPDRGSTLRRPRSAPRGDALRSEHSTPVKANRALPPDRLARGSRAGVPVRPQRTDRIEVVSVDDGEVILYWDVDPSRPRSCSSCCAPTSPASTPRSSSTSGSTPTPRRVTI